MKQQNAQQLAQSASALGAGILGFGLGAKWGNVLGNAAIWFIVLGSIFHVWGMYLIQMKGQSERRTTTAKLLWASAWICLLALIAILVYYFIFD